WNGRGYPEGLRSEAIPRLARIVAVADAFDAMTSDRSYRKGMSLEAAFTEVGRQAGLQFDPECAAAFLAVQEQIARSMGPTLDDTENSLVQRSRERARHAESKVAT